MNIQERIGESIYNTYTDMAYIIAEGKIGDWLTGTRKSFYRTKKEKAASKKSLDTWSADQDKKDKELGVQLKKDDVKRKAAAKKKHAKRVADDDAEFQRKYARKHSTKKSRRAPAHWTDKYKY